MKKVIITGASSGLGLEIGKILKENGYEVVNISRSDSPFIDIKADITDKKQLNDVLNILEKDHNDFEILILNAGIMPQAQIGEIDFDIESVFETNIIASISIVNRLTKYIRKNNSDIIVVGSTASFQSFPGDIVYGPTKFAVRGFIKGLQNEFKKDNVRVIGFHPGAFNSNLRGGEVFERFMDPKDLAKLMFNIINTPRSIQVSEIIIDRNKAAFS